jgi:hypothetical protein
MPGAQLPAKYLCLLLAMQEKAQGEPCKGARAQGQQGTLARVQRAQGQPCLLLPLLAYATSKGSLATFSLASKSRPSHKQGRLPVLSCLLTQATYARCASASKVHLPVVGYLCFLLTYASNLCPVRISNLCFWRLQRKGTRGGKSATHRHKGTLAWALRAQGHKQQVH